MAKKWKKTRHNQLIKMCNDKKRKEPFVVVKRSRIIIINYYCAPDLT
jgi:hypothetical protein